MRKRQKEWDDKLAGYERVDHFTVQPRDFTKNIVDHEAEYDIKFFDLVRKHSPEVQPWFYCRMGREGPRPADRSRDKCPAGR